MEQIKDTELMGTRKLLYHSTETGYSAFFTQGHNGVVVGKIREIITKEGKRTSRVDDPSYHKDMPRACVKLAEIEAEAGYTEGSLSDYVKVFKNSLDRFLSEINTTVNN
jgi:hypothetical protein